jgi:hypothetical protein
MTGLELPERYNAATDLLDSNLEAGHGDNIAIRTTSGTDLTYADVARAPTARATPYVNWASSRRTAC